MSNVLSVLSPSLWIFVIYRFVALLRRGLTLGGETRRLAWLSWLAFSCAAMAVTVYHPGVAALIGRVAGDWAVTIPRAAMGITGLLAGASVARLFAPQVRGRHNWPLTCGVLTLGVYILLAWAAGTGRLAVPPAFANQAARAPLADIFFNFYMLLLCVRVCGPAFAWAYHQERQRPMRWRFRIMLLVYAGITAWMLTGILEAATDTLGLAVNYTLVYTALAVVDVAAFSAAHLLPVQYFVAGVRVIDYIRDLMTLMAVRLVEARVARWNEHASVMLGGARQILRAPRVAVYRSLIACLDGRNLLKAVEAPAPRRLAQQLDWAARPELDYEETVARVRLIGLAQSVAEVSRSLPDLIEMARSRPPLPAGFAVTPDFLGESVITYLLQHCAVTQPPVPVEAMVHSPPAELARHIHLARLVPLGSTLSLLRIATAGPAAAANSRQHESEKRFALASALYVGLASTRRGRAIGWTTDIPLEMLYGRASDFARRLLVPAALLPRGWEDMPDEELARLFAVPADIIQARRAELSQRIPVSIPA